MSCLLRILGKDLDVDGLLRRISIPPNRIWRKDEPRSRTNPTGKSFASSGASFVASDADMSEFDRQVEQATAFLEKHCAQISAASRFVGVEEASIDFGVTLRDVAIHSDYLPVELLAVAAKCGLGLEISHYPMTKDAQEI